MKECTDEFTLQAYCDGELPTAQMSAIAVHLAACGACRQTTDDIAADMNLLAAVWAEDCAVSVPSESLRERLAIALAAENVMPQVVPVLTWRQKLAAWWQEQMALGSLVPTGAGLAVMLLTVGLGYLAMQDKSPNAKELAIALGQSDKAGWPTEVKPVAASANNKKASQPTLATARPATVPVKFTSPAATPKPARVVAVAPQAQPVVAANDNEPAPLPGEQSYLKALAVMDKTLAQTTGNALTPALRASYERSVAVLDQAIRASRAQARRNPQDTDAAEFLYSAYQSKLDLMTTVAQQTRPVIGD